MGRLVLRSSAVSGGNSFTFDSGWSAGSGSFTNGQTFTFNRGAADLGTGPNIAVYGNFRGGTVGAAVPTTQQIGAFSQMTDTNTGSSPPTYETGPDGDTWMNLLTTSLAAVGDGSWRQSNLSGLSDFDTFYVSYQVYTDGPAVGASMADFNEKSIWVTRGGLVDGTGHDLLLIMDRGTGSNAGSDTAISWGGGGTDNAYTGNDPYNGGYNVPNVQGFRSTGFKPHTTASVGALFDAFHQSCHASQRYQDSSTGLRTAWLSSGVTAAWNQMYFLGYYQHRGAALPKATFYLVKDFLFQTGANAWKRFFITDASTLAASRQMFDCPHTSWSSGQVSIFIPYGINLTGKYLWYGNGTSYTRVGQG